MAQDPTKTRKGRLVKISGAMLGASITDGKTRRMENIPTTALICIDISTCDPYPNAPARIWHPNYGKCWYIDTEFSQYEWLEDNHQVTNTEVSGSAGVLHSSR